MQIFYGDEVFSFLQIYKDQLKDSLLVQNLLSRD